ncbi:MAG TPA: hypothetical protein VGE56_07935 [Rhodocyclaceae bacterium]
MTRLLFALMMLWPWQLASAEVDVRPREELRDFEADPPGMNCDELETGGRDDVPIGTVEDIDQGSLLDELLCPECLSDPAFETAIPLRRIERTLIPPPSEIWGEFSCTDSCPRWLLRQGNDAIMIVHVGAQILCGVTGNCPGRAYERTRGQWRLVAEFTSNEGIELCTKRHTDGTVELWITSFDDRPDTWTITWKPEPPARSSN